jgi:hypothetical protein
MSEGFIGSVIEVQCVAKGRWLVYAIGDGNAYFEDFDSALQYVKELMEFRQEEAKGKP